MPTKFKDKELNKKLKEAQNEFRKKNVKKRSRRKNWAKIKQIALYREIKKLDNECIKRMELDYT